MNPNNQLPIPFDDYEISGVREFGSGADRYCEPVPDADAQFWSLYGHVPGEGVECIGDFKSRKDAEEIYARITGRPFQSPETHGRVRRFSRVLCRYTDSDDKTNLIDLLTDSHHWCRAKSVSFDDSLKMATEHFTAETTDGGRP